MERLTVPTFMAANPATPAPTRQQREWLLAALRDADRLLPEGIAPRSLDLMRERKWITTAPAADENSGLRNRLTDHGYFALLSIPKANALMSVLVSQEPGRIETAVQERTLASLVREGLVTMLTRRGEQDPDQEQHPYITNLGRRLIGLPEVDETPASEYLIAALAEHGITAHVRAERAEYGNTQVAYRRKNVEALFYRTIWNPGHYNHSATHPAWMHDKPWTGVINQGGHYLEKNLPNGLGLKEESARMAAAFAAWLDSRDDSAFQD
ncbi:hypothetical protein ABT173_28850 [Streptomyces sp. NPDC001795]|uniref:hypothetical protein n=1 Tax=Streptomyces sp. NPDC001795 TaxID=3154525 RepID=UPI003326297E